MARKGTLPLITDFDNIPDEALVPVEEQPYPIPEHWKWVRLGYLCSYIQRGKSPKYTEDLKFMAISQKCIRHGKLDLSLARGWDKTSFESLDAIRLLRTNDVLWNSTGTGTVGRVSIVRKQDFESDPKIAADSHVTVIRVGSALIAGYLFQFLSSRHIQDRVESELASGTTNQKELNRQTVVELPIPLPPKDEQLRIVEKLDAHLAQTNSAIAEAERFLAGFESYRNGLIQAGVSGQLTAQWRAQNGIKREDWVTHNLRELGKWGGGGTPRKSNSDFWENGTIPWVTPKDVKSWILSDTQDHVTPMGISGSTAHLYIGPAIAFVVRSGILRRTLPTTIVEGSFTANQDMKILHNISEDFDVRFIHHLVRSKEVGIRSSCAKSGTTVESIDFQKLLEFKLRLPLISEQKEIVRLVDSKLENLKQAEALAQESLTKLNALRDSLVSAALSGRLT